MQLFSRGLGGLLENIDVDQETKSSAAFKAGLDYKTVFQALNIWSMASLMEPALEELQRSAVQPG